jgi:hypothetical protein
VGLRRGRVGADRFQNPKQHLHLLAYKGARFFTAQGADDDDDGSGMEWVRKGREARE